MKLGPTGKFPEGKLNQHDEGELQIAVSKIGDNIHLSFGTSVAWFALSKEQAIVFANTIIKIATGEAH